MKGMKSGSSVRNNPWEHSGSTAQRGRGRHRAEKWDNTEKDKQLTTFFLNRSPFSNSGSLARIFLYLGLAWAAMRFAVWASYCSTLVGRFLKEAENSSHIPMGIPAYFMGHSAEK